MAYRHPESGKFISKAAYIALTSNAFREVSANLPDMIRSTLESDPSGVTAMVSRINGAVADRWAFERQKAPNGSHVEMRRAANFFTDNRTMAAFLIVVKADPWEMFNRTRKNGTRSNLKGFRKIRQLLDYIMGRTNAFERVSMALFASTIIAANLGVGWISSAEQELILSSEKVGSLPADIRNAISEYQHKHMTLEGDSRNQACQFRTTFANMGIYSFAREDFDDTAYTLGVNVDMASPIVAYLNARWQLDRFAMA